MNAKLLTSLQVDQSGKSCNTSGGTIVLQSHDKVYAPGGQYVAPKLSTVGYRWLIICRGIYADSKLGTVLYYHYMDTSIGISDGDARFGWNILNWGSGWPTV